jgi:Ca2+-transporting ATPase
MPTALLIAAAGISIVTGAIADAIAIGGVLAINAAIGFFTESESQNAIRSLQCIVRPSVAVIRDGNLQQVPSERVGPGDIIALKAGTYVGADARLIETEHLTGDESALTGESLPVAKNPEALSDEALALADRSNMVYMGTRVTGGQGPRWRWRLAPARSWDSYSNLLVIPSRRKHRWNASSPVSEGSSCWHVPASAG